MKDKKLFILSIAFFALLLFPQLHAEEITLHTIGDSTMSTYDENSTDKRGWGQMFQQFFTEGISVNNRAKSGASSKSFYNETPYWASVKTEIKQGDYVFIQFAHNDEKNNGLDEDEVDEKFDDPRGTSPWGTYQEYLRKYINESRDLGATPVLVTPIVRCYFQADTISKSGQHNLGSGNDHSLDYVAAMKAVAEEMEVSLIDHTKMTKELLIAYGYSESKALLYAEDDNTHTSALGAILFARMVAQDMVRQDILAEYINVEADFLVNPDSYKFGKIYINAIRTQTFIVMASGLSPAKGTITLRVNEPFSLSLENDREFTPTLTIDYSDNNLELTKFFVRCSPTEGIMIQENIEIIYNGEVSKTIPLTAEGVDMKNGTKATVTWQLTANSDFVPDGPINGIEEVWSKMKVQNYGAPNANTTWPEDSDIENGTRTQRNIPESGEWPAGEIDVVSDRYIQFGVTAAAETTLTIDSVGLYVGGAGGNGMRFRVYGSKDLNDFNDTNIIEERLNNTSNTMYAISANPMLELQEGESYYIRIYPWYNGGASGKSICIHGVTIQGTAVKSTSTGIKESNTLNNVSCIPSIVSSKTELTYILKTSSEVRIQLHSINGKELTNQYYGHLPVGSYTETMDLEKVSTGVYFCTLTTESGKETIKIIKK